MNEPLDRQRIDKWLWHARVVRTRTAAAGLVEGGLVRVNGERVGAASRAVRAGDVVTVALDRIRILKVTGFAERRGSASEAAALFEALDGGRVPGGAAEPRAAAMEPVSPQRPDKRARREIMRLKRPGNG